MMNRVTVSGLRLHAAALSSTSINLPIPISILLVARGPSSACNCRPTAAHQQRPYAASSSSTPESRRRAVTPFNDDGHVPWTDLSAGEKTARAAQQTFNFGMVLLGVALTVRPAQALSSFYESRAC